ncbi:MAG: cytochrome c3 family protein [Chloroflexota bacterium]|mgnify:FL=1
MNSRRFFLHLMMAMVLSLIALFVSANIARADDGFGGPEKCATCHKPQAETWAHAPHADAMKVTAFVNAWRAARSPAYCLECHTTGYDPKTGKYAFEGVTCESCHGAFKSDHPKQPMKVDKSNEMCGHCHKSTLNELNLSLHGQKGITCTACHDVHGTNVKAGTASALCEKCHASMTGKLSHASTAGKGLACADCHVGPRSGDPSEGHANTGHMFKVGTDTCSRCHSKEMHTGVQLMMGDDSKAPVTPNVAESGVGAPLDSGTALPMLGGTVIGIIIGLGWSRFMQRK